MHSPSKSGLARALEAHAHMLTCSHAHMLTLRCALAMSSALAACSIHKSQGMTIPILEVELASCFEAGHAYVALSRAVSLPTTRILTFDERKVIANPKVHLPKISPHLATSPQISHQPASTDFQPSRFARFAPRCTLSTPRLRGTSRSSATSPPRPRPRPRTPAARTPAVGASAAGRRDQAGPKYLLRALRPSAVAPMPHGPRRVCPSLLRPPLLLRRPPSLRSRRRALRRTRRLRSPAASRASILAHRRAARRSLSPHSLPKATTTRRRHNCRPPDTSTAKPSTRRPPPRRTATTHSRRLVALEASGSTLGAERSGVAQAGRRA